jgi:arginine decarboxylase
VRLLSDGTHRVPGELLDGEQSAELDGAALEHQQNDQRSIGIYFEVLFVGAFSQSEERYIRDGLRRTKSHFDEFVYELVFVSSLQEALVATTINHFVQAVIVHRDIEVCASGCDVGLPHFLGFGEIGAFDSSAHESLSIRLGQLISERRPELDLYMLADPSVDEGSVCTEKLFRRIFYRHDAHSEMHLTIMQGIGERFSTPFFSALRRFAKQPTGVFHALPISRGTSVTKSRWIHDMVEFYGINIFLAETSATTGGLDALLNPLGPLKKAQELAAKTFGAERTFFVTNGTSTANKIVLQAIVKPGDIVLVDRDCHKSHHYGMVLAGAQVSYLDSYPLTDFTIYGAVPLSEITKRLMEYKRTGLLDKVKMLLLTNCTFDGVVYNVETVMQACLAIKPDLIFLWDEAWFAFAGFHPIYRQRTAMCVAAKLKRRLRSVEFSERYRAWLSETVSEAERDRQRLLGTALPDPAVAKVRVYATQSTHKTLTAFRQASMIHVHDQEFQSHVSTAFHESYMTHTSTSPNYQLLASLDLGRRQVALEGFELVQKQIERAMTLRLRARELPIVAKYLRFLSIEELIPAQYRGSGISGHCDSGRGWSDMENAWANDEFVLDPTRLTLFTANAGIDGYSFRGKVLMDKYAIQINKTSRNTVLFMTNIGTTRSAVAYLLKCLVSYCEDLDAELENASEMELRLFQRALKSLGTEAPVLPHFSGFHPAFQRFNSLQTQDGDIREAFFKGYDDADCEYLDICAMTDEDVDALA